MRPGAPLGAESGGHRGRRLAFLATAGVQVLQYGPASPINPAKPVKFSYFSWRQRLRSGSPNPQSTGSMGIAGNELPRTARGGRKLKDPAKWSFLDRLCFSWMNRCALGAWEGCRTGPATRSPGRGDAPAPAPPRSPPAPHQPSPCNA